MSEYDYKCMTCCEDFDADFVINGLPSPPDRCPFCGDSDFITTEQYEENVRINLEDDIREDLNLFRNSR
jgi:hypothetical protein